MSKDRLSRRQRFAWMFVDGGWLDAACGFRAERSGGAE